MFLLTVDNIGRWTILLVSLFYPYNMYREYGRAKEPKRLALIGLVVMILLAILGTLSILLSTVLYPQARNPKGLFVVPLDLEFLTYWWTSPSEAWKMRRKKRRNLIMLSAISVILCTALFLMLLGE